MDEHPPSEASHDLAHALVNAMQFATAPAIFPPPAISRDAPQVIALARALDNWQRLDERLAALERDREELRADLQREIDRRTSST